ncbi:alanine--tRNA ligase [Planctomycetales bacterium]|nr:alanine--tRNA ligase [Planctomycetales bacterium]
MKTDAIRTAYLQFFADKGAKICRSDSLVPANDPTLLFTGAGMNQFKDYFLGIGKMDFRRATSCQKCIRTGDIMNVGVTSSHHTFFEMLGNFSFGDYFKEEAITWAWEFLTGAMKIPENQLQVSVHQTDDEAFNFWHKKIGLPAARIFRLGDHDNFWPADAPALGPNGPCGPCSEIFYDRGEQYSAGLDAKSAMDITHDCRRWVEIWNLVFTQFNRQDGGKLDPLKQRNIDTGMGLERMASCLQHTATNMDIDIFVPLVAQVAELSAKKYGAKKEDDTLLRRVADHARAVTFCLADGVMPGNTHRGYVLKRLLRRAALDGRTLGIRGAFLSEMVATVATVMRAPYPEIAEQQKFLAQTIRNEEEKFLSTLDKGLTLIDLAVKQTRENKQTTLAGPTVFELYDTYGFPYELTQEIAEKAGLRVDNGELKIAMEKAREIARAGAKMKGDIFARGALTVVKERTGGTTFVGYETLTAADCAVVAIIKGDAVVESATAGDAVTLVLDRTPFYGESGGQAGDIGVLRGLNNLEIVIDDTEKIDGIFLHLGKIESGAVATGMTLVAAVDPTWRTDIQRNHTATHLLHRALRATVGENAVQKGSSVTPERLRFDFQHHAPLTPTEIQRIMEIVSDNILSGLAVRTEIKPLAEAKEGGATALFGEKYGDTVRVVKIADYSQELCGGTHIDNTAKIGAFCVVGQEAVGSGIRRIEAVTGRYAHKTLREYARTFANIAQLLNVPREDMEDKIRVLLGENKELQKQTVEMKRENMKVGLQSVEIVRAAAPYVVLNVGAVVGKDLLAAADTLKARLGDDGVAVLAGSDGEKVSLVVSVGKNLVAQKKYNAGELVKKLAPIVGGSGGGKPELAQAGGKNPEKIAEMLAAARRMLAG